MNLGMDTAAKVVRDGRDVLRWARNPVEILKASVPASCVRRFVLNERHAIRTREALSPEVLGKSLQSMRHLLESEAIVSGSVDYQVLRGSRLYADFCAHTWALRHIYPVEFETEAERVAFWINLYNVLCIHGVIALGIRRSAMEVTSFFSRVAYRVGEWTFTPDDILSGVLRRGRSRLDSVLKQFRANDPRLAYAAASVDPRIHGAVVCLARSCPPVGYYSSAHLDHQLELAANHLIGGSTAVNLERRSLQLSSVLHYYSADFGDRASVERFVLHHLPPESRPAVERAFREQWPIVWQPYDWALNDAAGSVPDEIAQSAPDDAPGAPPPPQPAWRTRAGRQPRATGQPRA